MNVPPEPTNALIHCRSASFGYAGKEILSNLDLQVTQGDLIGIVGGNGSGKTTLFRGLLGLIKPLKGTVQRTPASIGYVPQREELDAVYPLTVREIVLMGASGNIRGGRAWWRSPSAEDLDRLAECLEFVAMESYAKAPFASLSGGQRQRCLLARALMPDPDILMLDEPTAGVDRASSAEILAQIARLHEERGIAVLMVAHQLDFARDVAKEIIIVNDGSLVRGPVSEMLTNQTIQNLFGAGALGAPVSTPSNSKNESPSNGGEAWTS